ncbi:Fe-S cluster assembly protein SufD [Candidatus Micrarchaeota archaeon]|nr:Fe-S cluster assembly protein SufD [Candidatus Micrarchaeota archaeon]
MLENIFTQTQFQKRFKKPPAWRVTAFKQFQTLPIPTSKDEAWRYTDLFGLNFATLQAVDDVKPHFKGHNVQIQAPDDENYGQILDKMSAWTRAVGNAVEIDVPAGAHTRLESTISLEKSGAVLQTVRVGAGAKLDFFEHYTSKDVSLLFGQKTIFHIADNSQLNYYSVQRFGQKTISFTEKEFHLADKSKLTCFHADMGGLLSRTTIAHHFDGKHTEAPEHSAVFFGSNHQHFDLTTQALHHGTATKSNILVKGALKDKASAVYRGVIRIDKEARQTDSYLQDRVLHLSKGVKSNSVPSLFIDNNDVKASHGATVSKLNDESLFYLRSRGLSRTHAEQLVVQGFLQDVIRKLPHERLRKKIEEDVQAKINQGQGEIKAIENAALKSKEKARTLGKGKINCKK